MLASDLEKLLATFLPNTPRMLGLFVAHEFKWGLERVPFHRRSSISNPGDREGIQSCSWPLLDRDLG